MLIALIARDKPGALEIRKANRESHLAYIDATGVELGQRGLGRCCAIGSGAIHEQLRGVEFDTWFLDSHLQS